MYAIRAYAVDTFGDLDILAPKQIRTGLRHWVINVAIDHLHGGDANLIDEIGHALDYYSRTEFWNNPEQYVKHVVKELIKYYNRFFDHVCRHEILHYDITNGGVFIITRDN